MGDAQGAPRLEPRAEERGDRTAVLKPRIPRADGRVARYVLLTVRRFRRPAVDATVEVAHSADADSSARLTILRWVMRFFSGPMWSIMRTPWRWSYSC